MNDAGCPVSTKTHAETRHASSTVDQANGPEMVRTMVRMARMVRSVRAVRRDPAGPASPDGPEGPDGPERPDSSLDRSRRLGPG